MSYTRRTVALSALFLFLLAAFAAPAMAHAGEKHGEDKQAGDKKTSSKEEEIKEEAVTTTILENFNFRLIGGFALIIVLLAVLGEAWYQGGLGQIPVSVQILLAVLTVSAVFMLFFFPYSTPTPKKTYGPGMGPLHMKEFYTGLNLRNARNIDDFQKLPVKKDIVNDPSNVPPPIERDYSKTVNITLVAQEKISKLTEDAFYYYWTYNGTVPGPILRVREGDTIRLTLKNEERSTHDHSIDLHAVNGPGGGAKSTQVPPGGKETIKFKALNPGFYVYHCGTGNIPTHISNQMFGGIIVQPKEGLPDADKRFALFQGEIYTTGPMGAEGFQPFDPVKLLNENPTYYTFNGKPRGVTGEHAMEAEVNDTVRIYFGNMGNSKISSFHVIGEQFKRYWPHGAFNITAQGPGVQTVPVADGSSAVVDMKLDVPGNYIPVDHALARLDRGAWGILNAKGEEQPEIYMGLE
ncbi:MAG: multicopper oxidase domain-containing protein [Candidatus Nanohaloarchaea archaeon]|nr:multicopper oxidase domain-containing protein [Candidatus Nanohaloarchaea archaeon]